MTPKWFRWITPIVSLCVVLSFIPLVLVYVNRATNSPDPRPSIIPDMDSQQKFKTQALNPLFADHRAMRPPVSGTVAQGMLKADDHFYHGIVNGQWAEDFPRQIKLAPELMARGQQRYTIYCAPCHGLDGSGSGPVSLRAEALMEGTWTVPPTYHSDTIRNRPVGHLFNTISNGIRSMPAYGTQIPPEDRWAIIAYLRALQLSQHAGLKDVPAGERNTLLKQAAAESASDQPGTAETAPPEGTATSEDQAASTGETTPAGAGEPAEGH